MTIPPTMSALVLRHDGFSNDPTGQQLSDLAPYVDAATIPVPQPGPGQALVRVARAAVNPSDVAFIKGLYGQARRRGVPAGFEGTGTVVAGDTGLVGRRVSFFATASGTWAQYALTDASGLIPLRDDVGDADAAGLVVNPITAMAMFGLVQEAGASSFVATAAGSQLGKFLMALGAEHDLPAIGVVRRPEQAETVRAAGAAEVLVTDGEVDAATRATLKRRAPTVLLDAVAGPVSANLFFAMADGTRWVIYGRLSPEPAALTQSSQFIFQDKRVEGFWLTGWMARRPRAAVAETIAEVQARFADGRWRTDIAANVPLDRAMSDLPAIYAQPGGKVLIAP